MGSLFSCPRVSPHEDGAHHRHHGAGRLLPRRAPARQGVQGVRRRAAQLHHAVRAHRAPRRPRRAPLGRSARPAFARRCDRRVRARRDLQPRRAELRADVVDAARAHRRVHRDGRDARARGLSQGRTEGALLPGQLERDVRPRGRDAADGDDAVLSAQPVRRGQGLRTLDHRELSRELRSLRGVRDPLQSREPAPRPRVRDAQGHGRRRAHQARPRHEKFASARSTRAATGASRATTSRRCGACCSSTSRRTS